VQALLPGSRLTWERGKARLNRYWRFRYPDRPSRARERDLVHELADRLRTAAQRQSAIRNPQSIRVGMALSAGLDSRIIAAALPEGGLSCAYTTGYPDSLDVSGARQLAGACGVRHLHLVPREDYMSFVAPETVWRTEGCFPFTDATSIQFHERLRPELDVILTGHAGGALSGQSLLPVPEAALRGFDVGRYLLSRTLAMAPEALQQILAPRVWRDEWEVAMRRFRAATDELADQWRLGDAATAWNMERRQARFIHHAAQVDRYDFEVRAPLLDNDVVDFFLTVPYGLRFAQRLYKRTLGECFPEAARIPWSKTGGPIPAAPAQILGQFYWSGAKRMLEKRVPALARRKKDRVRTPGVIAEEMRRDPAFRAGILEPFILGDGFPDEVLNRETARRLMEEHSSGVHNHWYALATLATVGLVYRHYIERGLQAPPLSALAEGDALRSAA
jgi:asparagine synthetase B (glutamine-hydrolysing)